MNPIRRRPCADPGQKQVPGEWMTQKGIDSSRPVTEGPLQKPRVRNKTKHTSVVTTVTPEIARHSPRNGFTAYFVLSPATNSSCHRHPRIKGLSEPGRADAPPQI